MVVRGTDSYYRPRRIKELRGLSQRSLLLRPLTSTVHISVGPFYSRQNSYVNLRASRKLYLGDRPRRDRSERQEVKQNKGVSFPALAPPPAGGDRDLFWLGLHRARCYKKDGKRICAPVQSLCCLFVSVLRASRSDNTITTHPCT